MSPGKNLIVCFDGTNNQIESSPTNVFRLFQALKHIPGRQEAIYLPGVGTMAAPGVNTPIRRRLSIIAGLAFGAGLQRDYEEAYRFLMRKYEPGDRIYIFGFSRGALTARALAGMLHFASLLYPGQEELVPYLARYYARADFKAMRDIRHFTRSRIKVEFLGLWDTVASYGFAFSRRTLPYTVNNRDVRVVRHALSLDERRAYFRPLRWGKRYTEAARKASGDRVLDQDIQEVWFPGVHSDVGGGYEAGELAHIPLEWMLVELRKSHRSPQGKAGKKRDKKPGRKATKDAGPSIEFQAGWIRDAYDPEDRKPLALNPCAVAHQSLAGAWWLIELLPRNGALRRGEFEWPRGRRRKLLPDPDGLVRVHASVFSRRAAYGAGYAPLPSGDASYTIVPWSSERDPARGSTTEPTTPDTTAPDNAAPDATRPAPATPAPAPLPELPALHKARSLVGAAAVLLLLGFLIASALYGGLKLLAPFREPLILFLLPMLALGLGSWVMGILSGLSLHSYKLRKPLVYKRWSYTALDLRKNIRHLDRNGATDGSREDGVASLRRALQVDFGFPLVYGPALWLTAVTLVAELRGTPLFGQPCWVLVGAGVLPVATLLADWVENALLLSQVHRGAEPDAKTVRDASRATRVKLACFTACTALPPFVWLVALAWRNLAN